MREKKRTAPSGGEDQAMDKAMNMTDRKSVV